MIYFSFYILTIFYYYISKIYTLNVLLGILIH